MEKNDPVNQSEKKKRPVIDETFCLGCGVCALKCDYDAVGLIKRDQRVLHPETTFERLIMQCLEKGTLQNQLFDNPGRLTHKIMRSVLGGFLNLPPVKQKLMRDETRSTFLDFMKKGARLRGYGWITKV